MFLILAWKAVKVEENLTSSRDGEPLVWEQRPLLVFPGGEACAVAVGCAEGGQSAHAPVAAGAGAKGQHFFRLPPFKQSASGGF